MARRRLVRNSLSNTTPDEKKAQPSAENGSSEGAPQQNSSEESSLSKDVTSSSNIAQGQEQASVQEDTKEKVPEVVTPSRPIRQTRRTQTAVSPVKKGTEVISKASEGEGTTPEAEQQVAPPTVKSSPSRRGVAKSTIQGDALKAPNEAQKAETIPGAKSHNITKSNGANASELNKSKELLQDETTKVEELPAEIEPQKKVIKLNLRSKPKVTPQGKDAVSKVIKTVPQGKDGLENSKVTETVSQGKDVNSKATKTVTQINDVKSEVPETVTKGKDVKSEVTETVTQGEEVKSEITETVAQNKGVKSKVTETLACSKDVHSEVTKTVVQSKNVKCKVTKKVIQCADVNSKVTETAQKRKIIVRSTRVQAAVVPNKNEVDMKDSEVSMKESSATESSSGQTETGNDNKALNLLKDVKGPENSSNAENKTNKEVPETLPEKKVAEAVELSNKETEGKGKDTSRENNLEKGNRERKDSLPGYNKDTEELDYEMSEEEEDNVSLAPDELVIMEEDPEYMTLFAEELDDKKEKRQKPGQKKDSQSIVAIVDSSSKTSGEEEKRDEKSVAKNDQDKKQNKTPTETSKMDVVLEKEDEMETITKDPNKFYPVCIIANPYYKRQLKEIEKLPMVRIIYDLNITSVNLGQTIKNCRGPAGMKVLCILISGVCTLIDHKNFKDCTSCKQPLWQIEMPYPSLSADTLVEEADAMFIAAQRELGSDGIMVMVPPLPGFAVDTTDKYSHEMLHSVSQGLKLVGNTLTLNSLEQFYNKYCRRWIQTGCSRISQWGNPSYFQEYLQEAVSHMFRSTEKPTNYQNALKNWTKALRGFIDSLLVSPSFSVARFETKEEETTVQDSVMEDTDFTQCEKVVIIGNTEYTGRLQELTKGMNVVHENENMDFDDDGVTILNRLQEKHTSKVLWVILSGISEVAEPLDEGPPKCKILGCREPIPTFTTKNDKLGDPDYKGMSADKMAETSVKVAFDFARVASEKLKDGSGLFLAPIMPLRGIWAGHATSHSHDALHRMYKCNPNVPHFVGSSSMWISSAKALENVWIKKTVENLSEDSIPYKLLKQYSEMKPPVFGYVGDVTLPEVKEVQERWTDFMLKMIRYFLTGSPDVQQVIPDLSLLPPEIPVQPPVVTQGPLPMPSVPSAVFPQDPMLAQGPDPGAVLSLMVHAASGLPLVPPVLPAPQPVFQPTMQAPLPQIPPHPSWLPPTSTVASSLFGPPPALSSFPVIETIPHVLPAPTALPVTDTQPLAGGCIVETVPQVKPAVKGHLIVEDMETDLEESQVRALCQEFGDVEDMKWPHKDHIGRKILMINYTHKRHAEKAHRLLSYLKVFGKASKIKLIGSDISVDDIKLESDDMELLLRIHGTLDQFRDRSNLNASQNKTGQGSQYSNQAASQFSKEPVSQFSNQQTKQLSNHPASQMNSGTTPYQQSSLQKAASESDMAATAPRNFNPNQDSMAPPVIETPVPQMQTQTVHTVIVKDFPTLVPLQDINDLFVELGALGKGVLIANALHFTFKGDPSVLKTLSGFRFYDKNIDIQIKGPLKDVQLSPSEKKKMAAKYKEPVSKIMNSIAKVLKDDVNSAINVYTFKTRSCRYSDGCKEKDLCHNYHNMSDRRRCPIVYRYSEEMCPEMELASSCPRKDNCSFAHSALEALFHHNHFRMNICPGSNSRFSCNKIGRVCANVHPGKPEMFYNEKCRNLYVEGLHKTLMYLAEAMKNLYLLADLQCLRILLITPTPEMANLYFNCVCDLGKACNQKVSELTGDTVQDGTSVLITSLDALRTLMNQNKGKKLDLNRLKALIIDDGSKVLNNMPRFLSNMIAGVGKKGTSGVNIVITAEKVTMKDATYAEEKLHPPSGLKMIIDNSDVWKQEDFQSSSSSGSYKNDLQENHAKIKERNTEHKSPPNDREIDAKSRSRRDDDRSRRDDDRSRRDDDRSRRDDDRSRRDDDRSRRDDDRFSSREPRFSRASRDNDNASHQVKNRDDLLSSIENDLEKAKKELNTERDRQFELYIQSPEIHPEYEVKYSVFMEQYRLQYPNRKDFGHSNKLWEEFWKELVTFMLKEEFDMKMQSLETEYQTKKERELKRLQEMDKQIKSRSREPLKRTSVEDDTDLFRKYRRTDRTSDVSIRRNEQYQETNRMDSNYNQRTYQSQDLRNSQPTRNDSYQPLKIPDGTGSEFSLEEAVNLFSELCPALGILGPATELLCKEITKTWSNSSEFCKIFNDADNRLVMQRIADKAKELGEVVGLGAQSLKLRLVSLYATQILSYASANSPQPSSSSKHFGLDVEALARATYNKDPVFIIQKVKDALHSKGIFTASEDQVTQIYVAVTSAHFGMACDKPKEKPQFERMPLKREAPDDLFGTGSKYRLRDTQSSGSWRSTLSNSSSGQWNSREQSNYNRSSDFANPTGKQSSQRNFKENSDFGNPSGNQFSQHNYDKNSDFAYASNNQSSQHNFSRNSDFGYPSGKESSQQNFNRNSDSGNQSSQLNPWNSNSDKSSGFSYDQNSQGVSNYYGGSTKTNYNSQSNSNSRNQSNNRTYDNSNYSQNRGSQSEKSGSNFQQRGRQSEKSGSNFQQRGWQSEKSGNNFQQRGRQSARGNNMPQRGRQSENSRDNRNGNSGSGGGGGNSGDISMLEFLSQW